MAQSSFTFAWVFFYIVQGEGLCVCTSLADITVVSNAITRLTPQGDNFSNNTECFHEMMIQLSDNHY